MNNFLNSFSYIFTEETKSYEKTKTKFFDLITPESLSKMAPAFDMSDFSLTNWLLDLGFLTVPRFLDQI